MTKIYNLWINCIEKYCGLHLSVEKLTDLKCRKVTKMILNMKRKFSNDLERRFDVIAKNEENIHFNITAS